MNNMLRYFNVFILLFFVFGLFAGCDDSGTNNDDTLIMPLGVGNLWRGTLWTFDETGEVLFEQSSDYHISESNYYNGKMWYIVDQITDGDTASGVFIFRNESDGLYTRYSTDTLAALTSLWAKFPASVGDHYYSGPGNIEEVTVTATDTVVETVYSEYICNVYKHELTVYTWPIYDKYYLAPNIGFAKIERYLADIDGQLYLYQRWVLELFEKASSSE